MSDLKLVKNEIFQPTVFEVTGMVPYLFVVMTELKFL